MKVATRRVLKEQIVVVAVLGSGKKSDAMWHVPHLHIDLFPQVWSKSLLVDRFLHITVSSGVEQVPAGGRVLAYPSVSSGVEQVLAGGRVLAYHSVSSPVAQVPAGGRVPAYPSVSSGVEQVPAGGRVSGSGRGAGPHQYQ